MFSHLPRLNTFANEGSLRVLDQSAHVSAVPANRNHAPDWLVEMEKDLGPSGTMWLFRQQASIDAFYISQKNTIVKMLHDTSRHMSDILKAGGVMQLSLQPLTTGRGRGEYKFVSLSPDERSRMQRHQGYIENWISDCSFIIARTGQLREVNGRAMIVEPAGVAGMDVDMAKGSMVGRIKDYVRVYREERSICQIVCENYLGSGGEQLSDNMSLLVFFGGLSIPQLLTLRDAGTLNKTLISEHLFSDDPLSTLHCGARLSTLHVGLKGHSSLYPGTAALAQSRAAARGKELARGTCFRYKDRTAGTTFQKNLLKQRRKTVKQRVRCLPPVEETDHRTLKLVNGVHSCVCRNCNSVNSFVEEYSSRTMVCTGCGVVETSGEMQTVSMDYERIERPERVTSYAYDPANHFRAWLDRVQAKETVFIPPEVVSAVEAERVKHHKSMNEMCVRLVRKFLQNCNFTNYYNNEYKILYLVAGIQPPVIPPDHERILAMMFQNYKKVWNDVKPASRKNRLSYSFLLNRFCKLQNWTQYQSIFRLPISDKNQDNQERIWKLACQALDWT